MCLCGTAGRGAGWLKILPVRWVGAAASVQCEKPKASLAEQFWSTMRAMLYHLSRLVSDGLPVTIVAMAF